MNDVLDQREPTTSTGSVMQSMSVKFDRSAVFAKLMMGVSFIAFLGAAAIYKNQMDRTFFIFIWSALWWYFIIGMSFFLSTTELIVSDAGLARKIFGRTYERIRWGDAKLVREHSKYSRSDETSYCHIEIHRRAFPLFKFKLERKMRLSQEGASGFDELVDLLNKYITMHAIRVEIYRSGQWEPSRRLVTTLT